MLWRFSSEQVATVTDNNEAGNGLRLEATS